MTGRYLRAKRIVIIGVVPSFAFQRAKYFVLELHRSMPQRFPAPEIHGLLEMEWYQRLEQWRRLYGLEFWRLKRPVAIFIDDKFVGSDLGLMKIISLENIFIEFIPPRNAILMKRKLRKDYFAHLKNTKRIYCYLDICVDNTYIGTLVFQLFSQILPRTCANFATLCLGTKGSLFSYKDTRIHRIVKNGWLQGGDIQYKTGGGGFSIYCNSLEDECYGISHDRRGVLSMANDGKHTNGSQFFITLKPCTWMDTYYVAFGHLIEGINVLNILETIDTFYEKPLKKIEIKNCGKLNLRDTEDIKGKHNKGRRDAKVENRAKKIEAIADQLMKSIMNEMMKSLALKERLPDVVHEGDISSIMNLELYFQGLYSLPENILEDCAKYARILRRENLRYLRPSATEIVEVITYDLLVAVMTKMIDLDHVREATGQATYQKLLEGIDIKLEITEKAHVRQFVDQLVKTSETIIEFISKKLNAMRISKKRTQDFQEQMNAWIQSFVMQETFADDSFCITKKSLHKPHSNFTKKEVHENCTCIGQESCTPSKKKQEDCSCKPKKTALNEKKRIGNQQIIAEIYSSIREKGDEDEVKVSNFFSSCRYELKKPIRNQGGRIPVLDLIEISRFHLRLLRYQEKRLRSKARICLEKKINKWMEHLKYTSETEWIRQTVFSKEDICINHTEEIMYGAITVALLEIYFLLEQYLKTSKMKFRTRITYPKNMSSGEESVLAESQHILESVNEKLESTLDWYKVRDVHPSERKHRSCLCGDICCDCEFAPIVKEETSEPPTPPPSFDSSTLKVTEGFESGPVEAESLEKTSFFSSAQKINLEELLAQTLGVPAEKVDIMSFKWMQDYIQNKGCSLKSEFVVQVHKWLGDEIFDHQRFLSNHSLISKASLLSFSMSLASLIKEENKLNSKLKDFIYDLWELYFKELLKEAQMKYPPEPKEILTKTNMKEGEKDEETKRYSRINTQTFNFDNFRHETEILDFGRKEPGHRISVGVVHPNSIKRLTKDFLEIKVAEKEITSAQEKVERNPTVRHEQKLHRKDKTGKCEVAGNENKRKKGTAVPKRRKSPVFIQKIVEGERKMGKTPPCAFPFWIKFITEITKRALGQLSKMNRFPRRLFFTSDSLISFDDKMHEWFEFNKVYPSTTRRKDIKDYIVSHHAIIGNLHDTARSFLKKKIIFQLLEKNSRSNSAEILTKELILHLLGNVMKKIEIKENEGKIESGKGLCCDLMASIINCSIEMIEDCCEAKMLITNTGETKFETSEEESLDSIS